MIRLFGLVIALVTAFPFAARAQEIERFAGYADIVIACFSKAGAEDRSACIGQGIAACQASENDHSTIGTVVCINAETAGWSQLVDLEYLALMEELSALDRDYPPARADLSRVGAFAAAHHAWRSWRDAECFSQYAQWQGGSIRSVKASDCRRLLTAERAIALKDQRDGEN